LGGGNHFIEVAKGEGYYLIIHSGSRHLGKQVAEYYQKLAKMICQKKGIKVANGLEYLEWEEMENYLHDMRIMQHYAKVNRESMAEIIGEMRSRWPLGRVALWHRLGRVNPGEASIAIVVSARHRKEAFAACQYAIDRVKQILPVWKKEHRPDGSFWVEGFSAEDHRL
jgi:molybdopterin synthase catalytic subunit